MSLQVSNQTSGRRTPQVYQGFGGVAGAGGAATTPTASNGSSAGSGLGGGGGGSVGRPPKGAGKQSQIPIAISGAGSNETTVPPMAVVQQGGPASLDGSLNQSGLPTPKQYQFDHQYGTMLAKDVAMQLAPGGQPSAGSGRKATNGSGGAQQTNTGNMSAQKKGSVLGSVDVSVGKLETTTTNVAAVAGISAEGSKLRDSPRSGTRAQQQQQQKLDEVVASPKKQEQQQTPKPFDNLLLAEKPLKGFGIEDDDMESLMMSTWDWENEDSPLQPVRSGTTPAKSKLPKATPQVQVGDNPSKTSGKQDNKTTTTTGAEEQKSTGKKTTGNTEKQQQQEEMTRSPKAAPVSVPEADPPSTPTSGGGESLIGRPLRSISGRRSTRPISDIKLTFQRRSTDAHDDSFSSLNVTVGSDVGNNSLLFRTPGSATRKRKDMTPESTSDGPAHVDSPKRARLDFSGFLGFVASPVTMLKNRLSRVKLQSPSVARSLAVEEENASKVVTAEATTTTSASVTTPLEVADATKDKPEEKEASGATSMDVDVANKEPQEKIDQTELPPKDDTDQQQSSSSTAADDEVEVKIVTDKQQKQWCSIM
ncbi:uncharacterized protein LOC128723745 [Anopheles nili]|uniref:uncharacterized protein LOC128723745 n=1 Tax=Anopheles nili TaxID=185578 RepID=UPI00237B1161|nr:uncharacterized protein LOC128723745 [Anopheles nili]